MRRATITLSDELEAALDAYLARQDAPPSLTAIVQAALQRYLEDKRAAHGPRDRPHPLSPVEASEVAEPGLELTWPGQGGVGGARPSGPVWSPPRWTGAGRIPRLDELPELLRTLPRLSEDDLSALANDLEQGREELAAAERHASRDPWDDGETGS